MKFSLPQSRVEPFPAKLFPLGRDEAQYTLIIQIPVERGGERKLFRYFLPLSSHHPQKRRNHVE